MADVFISYSRKDKAFVQVLHQALAESKYDAWIDWQDIPPTADWWAEIEAGIEAADAFLFVISPDSVASRVCNREVDHAVANNKRIIPIVRREGFNSAEIHRALSRHNWIYFRGEDDFDAAFKRLVEALDLDLPYVKIHTRLLIKTLEWEHKQRRDDLLLRGDELTEAEQWIHDAIQVSQEPAPTEQQKTFITTSRDAENAQERIIAAGDKARRMVRFGSVILATMLGVAALAGGFAYRVSQQARRDKQAADLELAGLNALKQLEAQPVEAVVTAMKAAQQVQQQHQTSNDDAKLLAYSPVMALDQALREANEKNWFFAHNTYILTSDISPDGKIIAIPGTEDGIVKLWSASGIELATLNGHGSRISGISFSPDGQTLVSCAENEAIIWDLDGNPLAVLSSQGGMLDVRFSPDGQFIATASQDGTTNLWKTDGTLIREIVSAPLKGQDSERGLQNWRVAFSPDSQNLAIGRTDAAVQIVDLQGQPVTQLIGHQKVITAIDYSLDGKYIVTAAQDNTARLWTASGEPVAILEKGHENIVWSAAFSPDGNYIATASEDSSIQLWDLNGNLVTRLKGHLGGVGSVNFTPDGETLVSVGDDGAIRFWQVGKTSSITLSGHQNWIEQAEFTADGQSVVTSSGDGTVRLWDLTGNTLVNFAEHSGWVHDVASNLDGLVASVADDALVKIWNTQGETVGSFRNPNGAVWDIDFSPDNQHIALGTVQGIIRIIDVEGNEITSFKGYRDAIWKIKYNPTGQTVGATAEKGGFRLWNLEGELLNDTLATQESIYGFDFSPDNRWLVTASRNHAIRLWDANGTLVREIPAHTGEVKDVAFSPDSRYIASGAADNIARVWDLSGNQIAEFRGHSAPVDAVNFSPDGKLLVTGSYDHTAKIWPFRSLDERLADGCQWLDAYLITYPAALADLEICHTPELLARAAAKLQWQGEESAKAGNTSRAVQLLRQAQAWNPELNYDADRRAEQFALIGEGENLAQLGQIEEARAVVAQMQELAPEMAHELDATIARLGLPALLEKAEGALFEADIDTAITAFKKAQTLDATRISDFDWAHLCTYGSILERPEDVLWACDLAVEKDSQPGRWRNRRAMARALSGDTEGAIADLEAFMAWTYSESAINGYQTESLQSLRASRQPWLDALKVGENPFTPEVLESLQ